MRSFVGVFFIAAVGVASACTEQFGSGPVPAVGPAGDGGAEDAKAPVLDATAADTGADVAVSNGRCSELSTVRPPKVCNGDVGSGATSACPPGLGICAGGDCVSSCATENICAQAGHAGPICEEVGFFAAETGGGGDARCGAACGEPGDVCPSGSFCDVGIGHSGGVCLSPFASGSVFSLASSGAATCDPDAGTCTSQRTYATCAAAGAVACGTGKAFGLNEGQDFQGWCVCGSPPGSACAADADCSDLRCGSDKKCGAKAGDLCTPRAAYEVALLPETSCRTACSRTTCSCEPECVSDADCGGPTSAKVCNAASVCVSGCRAYGGNGCGGQDLCTSRDMNIGICTDGF